MTTEQQLREALAIARAYVEYAAWTEDEQWIDEDGSKANVATMCLRKIDAALALPPDADARDAKRYRCLRAMNWYESPFAVVRDPKEAVKLGHDCPTLDRLDEAIDEVIAAQGAKP